MPTVAPLFSVSPPSWFTSLSPSRILPPAPNTCLEKWLRYGTSNIVHAGFTCSKPTTMWCSRCQSSWYCCSDHLEFDWPRHKDECLSLAALSPTPIEPPPSMPFTTATFAAIIFPVDELRPRIIHIECLAFIEPASSLMNWTPRVREHMLADPQDTIGSLTIETGISEGAPLRYPLQVFFKRSGPTSHLVNQSVYSLSKGQATQTGGPIIVLKYSGTRRQGYIDASFNDLPTLVSYFIQSTSKRR